MLALDVDGKVGAVAEGASRRVKVKSSESSDAGEGRDRFAGAVWRSRRYRCKAEVRNTDQFYGHTARKSTHLPPLAFVVDLIARARATIDLHGAEGQQKKVRLFAFY